MANKFFYKARDARGNLLRGTLEADSRQEAVRQLREEGLFVSSLTAQRLGTSLGQFLRRDLWPRQIPADVLSVFCRQFAVLVRTGSRIVDCLRLLAAETRHRQLQAALQVIRQDVRGGLMLAESMRKFPNLFPEVLIRVIEVGEQTGSLDEVLQLMARYYEREYEVRGKVKQALTYPGIILGAAFVAIGVLMLVILPGFAQMFNQFGADLPLFTRIILDLKEIVAAYWHFFLAGGLIVAAGGGYFLSTTKGKRFAHWVLLHLPVIGELITRSIFSRFSRTLGLLLHGGVSVVEALRIAAKVTENVYVANAVERMRVRVEQGETLGGAASEETLFPRLFVQMLVVGEESGALIETLSEIAIWYDREVEYEVEHLTAVIEPVAIILMTGVVLMVASLVLVPLFNMITAIG